MLKITNILQIDIDNLILNQEKYKNELLNLQKEINFHNYNYENDLKEIIEKETIKYKPIVIRDLKIKKKKINEYIEKLNNEIYHFIIKNISNNTFSIELYIKQLNKIIFPKGIWGETMSPSGQRYYKNYESGKYRTNEEFISVGGTSYYFVEPIQINQSIKSLDILLKNKDILPIIKNIIYIFYFWNIHPFNDGNGAIARFLFPTLCLINGFKPIAFEYKYFLINHKTNLFYDKNNLNFNDIISDFIKYIKK